jgi:hypothetical protein
MQGRHRGLDVALARGTTRSYRQHVDLDLAVVGREPMLDAGDDGEGRSRFAECRDQTSVKAE